MSYEPVGRRVASICFLEGLVQKFPLKFALNQHKYFLAPNVALEEVEKPCTDCILVSLTLSWDKPGHSSF